MMSTSTRATSGFRRLLRAARAAFKDDSKAIKLAKIQLKQEFLRNKDISNPNALNELFKGVDEAEELLSFQIVQGKKNVRGNYANNMEAIQQDQSLPHGPELAPIDTSVLGLPVIIQKTKARKE